MSCQLRLAGERTGAGERHRTRCRAGRHGPGAPPGSARSRARGGVAGVRCLIGLPEVVRQAKGNFTRAARFVGVHPNHLHRLIRKLEAKGAVRVVTPGAGNGNERGADAMDTGGRPHPSRRQRETRRDPARSETPRDPVNRILCVPLLELASVKPPARSSGRRCRCRRRSWCGRRRGGSR